MTPASFMALFDEFREPSWARWREILESITPATRELYVAAGRGSGKSRMASLIACAFSARKYKRAPGELIHVAVVAPTREQAALTFGYARGLIGSRAELAALVSVESKESIELAHGVALSVVTAGKVAPRGRSYAAVVVEEAAFLPRETSANPDVELLRAVRPGLARVPGSLLVVVSSPYSRGGILWQAAQRAERGGDPSLVYVQLPTLDLNPTFDRSAVAQALAEDPVGARAEYLAEFRSDVESYVSRDVVEDNVERGRRELPPVNLHKTEYIGFVDLAGGSGTDSATLAIAHVEQAEDGQRAVVLDCLRERRPPFSPEAVCAEFSETLKAYRITRATADRYAADFATEAMERHGVVLDRSEKPKSDLYRELLPILNSGHVDLLDHDRLVEQLVGLERRVARGGRDTIDHAPRGHDDLANVVAGVVVAAFAQSTRPQGLEGLFWGRSLDWMRERNPHLTQEQHPDLLRRRAQFARVAAASKDRSSSDYLDDLCRRYGIER